MLVIKRGFDFSKWLLHHTGKFPKSYRFSVAVKMENACRAYLRYVDDFVLFSHSKRELGGSCQTLS